MWKSLINYLQVSEELELINCVDVANLAGGS